MSAVLDLHPATGHRVLAAAASMHEVLDSVGGVGGVGGSGLTAGEYAEALVSWDRLSSRVEAMKLMLVAAADSAGVAAETGLADTSAWLARATRTPSAEAAGQTRLAQVLDAGLPLTGAALSQGDVSPAHASVIARAADQLPAGLTPAETSLVEASLVEKAKRLDPRQLRVVARRAVEEVRSRAEADAHEDALLADEESGARAATRLTLHDNDDGTVTGHFTVPGLAGAVLRRVLDAMTAPRRGRLGATDAQAGPQGLRRDWAHERGLALTDLLEHLPTDHLHTTVAATVVVTLDLDTLTDRLAAARLDTGGRISAGDARRLACNAGLVPAVLGTGSVPLDLGRTARLFSDKQRTALATRHSTCGADGCQRPFAWCELHHLVPWSRGGRTDLDQAVPLCAFHHQRIHDSAYLHQRLPDGTIRFSRRV